jgi:hypothetical protein
MNSLFASEPLTKYNWTTMVVDVAIGIVTFILVIPVALYLGGFSFFTPWVIALIPLFFLCGFLRGASPERIWAKACAISAGASCPWLVKGWLSALLFVALTFGPIAAGVFARRRLKSRVVIGRGTLPGADSRQA